MRVMVQGADRPACSFSYPTGCGTSCQYTGTSTHYTGRSMKIYLVATQLRPKPLYQPQQTLKKGKVEKKLTPGQRNVLLKKARNAFLKKTILKFAFWYHFWYPLWGFSNIILLTQLVYSRCPITKTELKTPLKKTV